MPISETTPNAKLAYQVLDRIDADPSGHMQDIWIATASCGTVACFAGWACLLSGDQAEYEEDEPEAEEVRIAGSVEISYIPTRAARLLGITPDGGTRTGYRLFEPHHDRETLGDIVEEIFGPRPADQQEIGDTRPRPPVEHRCEQPAKCWADPGCPVYSSRGAGGKPTAPTSELRYFCPASGDVESAAVGGFDTCCDRPDLHRVVTVVQEGVATAPKPSGGES